MTTTSGAKVEMAGVYALELLKLAEPRARLPLAAGAAILERVPQAQRAHRRVQVAVEPVAAPSAEDGQPASRRRS